jgi:thiamine pyrophosphokinase
VRALIVANGDVDAAELRRLRADGDALGGTVVICADGGAMQAIAAGVVPDLVIGDGDSLSDAEADGLRRDGIPVRIVPADKDQSDTELCILEAVDHGSTEIIVLGAMGGQRIEHALANVALLALPALHDRSATILHGPSTVRVIGDPDAPSALELDGSAGDFVSLLPFGDGVEGVTTEGLRYPLRGEPLPLGPARGLSNELTGSHATVQVRGGRLMVVHTRRDAVERGAGGLDGTDDGGGA